MTADTTVVEKANVEVERSGQESGQTSDLETGVKPGTESPPSDTEKPTQADDHVLPQTRSIRGVKWLLACVAMFSANLLYGLDTTIAADIQAPVAETFGEISKLGWLGIGFTLGSVVFILPLGKAYAVFDTKWLFIGCLTMFSAGSALCGGAPNMNAIIIGRIWAGAGGAGMYLGNINYITILTSPEEQPLYIGIIGLSFGSGLILGPIVGGLFADSPATWRWAFYINLVIFAIMVPLYFFILPSKPRRPGTTFIQRVKTIDWLGIVLSAGVYVSFVLFVSFGGNQWEWKDGRTIACIVMFVVLLVAFGLTQAFSVFTTPDDRLFPCEMILDRTLVMLYINMAANSASIFVVIYYVPLYFQFVNGDSGTQSAIRLLPFVTVYVAVVTACGRFMGKTGWYIYWYIISGIFLIIGSALMYTVRLSTPVANIYGYCILIAIGTLTSQAGYAVGPTLVQPNRIHEVLQFMNVSQGQSLLLGLAIASAIFQNRAFGKLHDLFSPMGFSDAEIRGAIAGARSTVFTQAAPDVREKALEVIVAAINDVYIMVIAAGVCYVICSCLLPHKR